MGALAALVCFAPDWDCEPDGARLHLQGVLKGVCCGDLFCVLITLLASGTPNRIGAHKASLAAQALSLGKSLAGQGRGKVPLSCEC